MKKKSFILALALGMLIGLLGSCGGQESTSAEATTTKRSELNVAVELFPATLEPSNRYDAWYIIRCAVGETLVKYANDGSLEPWLAESWEVAEDTLTWTFALKDGIKFSNGVDMTATKVVESIERLFTLEDPANGGDGNPQRHFTYSSITADDDANEIIIVTENPAPDLPGCLAYPWTLILDVEATDKRNVPIEGPICTGPYKFDSFTQDSIVTMVRNDNYWKGDVPFDTVNMLSVAEASTRTLALQDGSVDMALNISAADRKILEEAGGFDIGEIAGTRIGYAHLNVGGVLSNDALRQAVFMAIDGQTIADAVTNGAYTYGFTTIPPDLGFGYDELDFEFTYDPSEAIKILDEAGIVDTDGDGYRELDGEMINIDYKVSTNRQLDKIGQAQAIQLEEIGIKATVEISTSIGQILTSKMFDIACSNEIVTPTGDPAKFFEHWYSSSDANYSNYVNSEYDEIYDSLRTEFDTEVRREYLIQLQQILLDDAAVLMYGYFNYNICSVDTLTGINLSPNDFYWIVDEIRFIEE